MSKYPRFVGPPLGPKAKDAILQGYFLLSPSAFRPYPLVVDSAEDCMIRDVDGHEYIDFTSCSCIMNIGHTRLPALEAVKQQSGRLLYCAPTVYHEPALALARSLINLVPGSFNKKVFYAASESETIDAAIKLVKWHTRRHRLLSFTGASHGTTLGALSLSGNDLPKLRRGPPLLGGAVHVPYPDCYRCPFKQEFPACNYWCIDFIEDNVLNAYLSPHDVAGVFFESIQWLGGCIIPPPDYFRRLKKLADKHDLLLVDDEAYTGMGRTGRWFGIEHWQVSPDVICVSGALASGLPLGAVVSKAEIMDWEPTSHGSLMGGSPLACALATAVITTLRQENLVENSARRGRMLLRKLMELKEKYSIIGDVRGKGLLVGIELVKDEDTKEPNDAAVNEIVLEGWKRGVLLNRSTGSTLLLSPPLSITEDLVDRGLELLEGSIAEVNRKNKAAPMSAP
jgi:4-aminobutyrate aminotransferase